MAVVNSNRINFKEVVDKYLLDYHMDCVEAMTEAIQETAQEGVKKLKATSPVGKGPKKGAYKRNWTYKMNTGRFSYGAVIYGKKPTYRLAHLLQNGHPIKRHGRIVGQAGQAHDIQAVHDWLIDEAVDKVIEKMEAIP